MHIQVVQQESFYNLVLTSDEGKELVFDFKEFKANIKRDQDILFVELNLFWSKIGANRRKQIFELYERFIEIVEGNYFDQNVLHENLTELSKELMIQHNLDELLGFVASNIGTYPETIQKSLNIADNLSYSKTYTWDKYRGLVAISIASKAMAPIWSFYLKTISVTASDVFKDMVAYKLLNTSWFPVSKPVDDLLEYIKGNISVSKLPLSAQVNGLGEADMPRWLLAITVIRRLMLRPLLGNDINLVIDVYKLIKNKSDVPVLNRLFKGKIKRKDPPPTSGSGDDDHNSILENFKIKEPLTTGDRVVFSSFARNLEDIGLRIDEDLDLKRLRSCYSYFQKRGLEATIEPFQKRITQWVCSTVMSPRAIETYRKDNLLGILAVTQALVWQWGFPKLAILLSGEAVVDQEEPINFNPSRSGSIPKDKVQRLLELYPHKRADIKKSDAKSHRNYNEACISIDIMAKDIGKYDWNIIAPNELLDDNNDLMNSSVYVVPPDIRSHLADLVIFLAEMQNSR